MAKIFNYSTSMLFYVCFFVLCLLASFFYAYHTLGSNYSIEVVSLALKNKSAHGSEVWIVDIGDAAVKPSSFFEEKPHWMLVRGDRLVLLDTIPHVVRFKEKIKNDHVLTLVTHSYSGLAAVNINGYNLNYDLYSKDEGRIVITKTTLAFERFKKYILLVLSVSCLLTLGFVLIDYRFNIISSFQEKFKINNKYARLFSCWPFLCILVMSYVGITKVANIGYDNSDMSAYLAGGIHFLKQGSEYGVYPGILFQLVAALFSGFLFGQPQIVYVAYASCFIFTITNYFLFKICKMFFNTAVSLLIVCLIIHLPFMSLYINTATRALTDPWLIGFTVISSFYILRGKPFLSGFFSGLGVLFRMQGFQFLLLTPLAYKSLKKYCVHVGALFLIFISANFFFNVFFTLKAKNSDFSFYNTMLSLDVPDLWNVIKNATITLIHYDFMAAPLLSLLAGGYFFFNKNKTNLESRLNAISLSIVLSTIVFGYYYMNLYLLTINFINPVPDIRYVAYALPLSFIVICVCLKSLFFNCVEKFQASATYGRLVMSYFIIFQKFSKKIYRCVSFVIYTALLSYLAVNFTLNNTNSLKNIVHFNPNSVSLDGTVAVYPWYRKNFVYIYHGFYPQVSLSSYNDIFEKSYDTLYIMNKWGDPIFEAEIEKLVAEKIFSNKAHEVYEKVYSYITNNLEIYVYKRRTSGPGKSDAHSDREPEAVIPPQKVR